MDTCSICLEPIDGPQLGDAGDAMHPACLAGRLPEDAVVALGGLIALVLAPPIFVWAG
jgi:hypothetical protein